MRTRSSVFPSVGGRRPPVSFRGVEGLPPSPRPIRVDVPVRVEHPKPYAQGAERTLGERPLLHYFGAVEAAPRSSAGRPHQRPLSYGDAIRQRGLSR